MNRRNLFKGLAGVAGALILPPTLAENAEAAKLAEFREYIRWLDGDEKTWALGAIPQEQPRLAFQIDEFKCMHNSNPFPDGDQMRDLWHLMICLPRELQKSGLIYA